jgi:hypothetical protein
MSPIMTLAFLAVELAFGLAIAVFVSGRPGG